MGLGRFLQWVAAGLLLSSALGHFFRTSDGMVYMVTGEAVYRAGYTTVTWLEGIAALIVVLAVTRRARWAPVSFVVWWVLVLARRITVCSRAATSSSDCTWNELLFGGGRVDWHLGDHFMGGVMFQGLLVLAPLLMVLLLGGLVLFRRGIPSVAVEGGVRLVGGTALATGALVFATAPLAEPYAHSRLLLLPWLVVVVPALVARWGGRFGRVPLERVAWSGFFISFAWLYASLLFQGPPLGLGLPFGWVICVLVLSLVYVLELDQLVVALEQPSAIDCVAAVVPALAALIALLLWLPYGWS